MANFVLRSASEGAVLLAGSFDRPASPLVPLLPFREFHFSRRSGARRSRNPPTKPITNTICQVRLSTLKFASDLWECHVGGFLILQLSEVIRPSNAAFVKTIKVFPPLRATGDTGPDKSIVLTRRQKKRSEPCQNPTTAQRSSLR